MPARLAADDDAGESTELICTLHSMRLRCALSCLFENVRDALAKCVGRLEDVESELDAGIDHASPSEPILTGLTIFFVFEKRDE